MIYVPSGTVPTLPEPETDMPFSLSAFMDDDDNDIALFAEEVRKVSTPEEEQAEANAKKGTGS